jgi:hypothetical protein
MTLSVRARAVSGVAGAALALLVAGAPAQAAPVAHDTSVSVGRLVLDPTDRGYHGSLPVTVRYGGAQPGYLNMTIVEPVAGAFDNLAPAEVCFFGAATPRRTIFCGVPGGALQPGERRSFTVDFTVLTGTRAYPMVASGGQVRVETGDANPTNDSRAFDALFRSTGGSVRNPRPYVQDTLADASVKAAGPATLVRQPDGSYLGRLPLTIRYGGDAPHDELAVEPVLPAGIRLMGIDPPEICTGWCSVPGGEFMSGEKRTVDLKLAADPGTVAGPLGTGAVHLHVRYSGVDVTDVEPADNSSSFDITAVDAA